MQFRLDPSSTVRPYEQLRAHLADLVATGELRPGTRLPPIRALAAELDLAPGTVARTYRELEEDGIVETRGRQGTFVVGDGSRVGATGLAAAAEEFVGWALAAGASPASTLDAVRAALRRRGGP